MSTAYSFDGEKLLALDWEPQRTLRWAAWRPDGAAVLAVGNGGYAVLSDGVRLDAVETRTDRKSVV